MRAIARSAEVGACNRSLTVTARQWMLSRVLLRTLTLIFFTTATALADTHSEVVDLFASMTAALTEDPPNAAGFMKAFDRKLPDYDELNRSIKALLLDSEVESSVDFVTEEGDAQKRTVDLDWYMVLRSHQPGGPSRNRREIIHCELLKEGKRWRITSITPTSIFKP